MIADLIIKGVLSLASGLFKSKEDKQNFELELAKLAAQIETQTQESVKSAREAYIEEFKNSDHSSPVNQVVDAINRLIRPTVTIGLILMLFSVVPVPKELPGEYWDLLSTIMMFWFGGRLISKDGLGSLVKSVLKK